MSSCSCRACSRFTIESRCFTSRSPSTRPRSDSRRVDDQTERSCSRSWNETLNLGSRKSLASAVRLRTFPLSTRDVLAEDPGKVPVVVEADQLVGLVPRHLSHELQRPELLVLHFLLVRLVQGVEQLDAFVRRHPLRSGGDPEARGGVLLPLRPVLVLLLPPGLDFPEESRAGSGFLGPPCPRPESSSPSRSPYGPLQDLRAADVRDRELPSVRVLPPSRFP